MQGINAMTKAEMLAIYHGSNVVVTKCKAQSHARGDRNLHRKTAGAAPATLLDTARRGRKFISAHELALALHFGR